MSAVAPVWRLLTFAERILCSHRKWWLISATYCASFTRCSRSLSCYLLASFQAADFISCPLTSCEPSWHHSVMRFHPFILLNASHIQTDKIGPFITFLTKEHVLMEPQHTRRDLSNFLSPPAFKIGTHLQEIWLFYIEQLEDLSRMPPPWIYKTAEDLVAAVDERETIIQRQQN